MEQKLPIVVAVRRVCVHCGNVFEEQRTIEEIRKSVTQQPISICPNPTCQLPT